LIECGFEQSDFKLSLLMKSVCVEDTIYSGVNGQELEKEIASLGYDRTNSVTYSYHKMKGKSEIS